MGFVFWGCLRVPTLGFRICPLLGELVVWIGLQIGGLDGGTPLSGAMLVGERVVVWNGLDLDLKLHVCIAQGLGEKSCITSFSEILAVRFSPLAACVVCLP